MTRQARGWRRRARPSEVAGSAGAGRRPVLTRAAWGTAPVVLATLAVINPGAPVSQVDLHDGTVWLTNEAELALGRYNPAVEELNAGLVAGGTPFDVLQDGFDVLLLAQGTLAVVDPAAVALAGQTVVGPGVAVSMAAGTTAVTDPADGDVWARPTAMIGGLRIDADAPDLELGAGGAAVVARSGTVLGVGDDGVVHRLRVSPDGGPDAASVEEAGTLAGGFTGQVDAITAVGDEVAVLAGRTLLTRSAAVDLSAYQGTLALQQPGPAAGTVLVAAPDALLEVPLDGGEPRVLRGGGGQPTAPVRVAGCVHAAWASPSDNYLRLCSGQAEPEVADLEEVASSDRLVFRVNRDVVALNDVANGRLWLPMVDTAVRVPNWTDVEEDDRQDEQEQDREAVTSQTLQAECSADAAPPSAVDDEFGVRPGRTTILPVVDNDASSACGILVISSYDEIDDAFGTLTPVYGGRALQLTVRENASGSVGFTYSVTDGRGSAAPATATVRLTVRGAGENAAPEQIRVGALVVEQGGTGTYDVLADFRDPDGDPMVLVSAAGTGGTARARGDGRLRFQADGSTLGRQTVTVVVSDGTAQVEGTLFVDIRPAGSLPPVLEPLHLVTYVDEPVTVHALDSVRSQGREAVRLAGVDEVVGLTLETDLDAGTFTVTARTAGTYYVPYTVAAPPQQATGLARIDVLEAPEEVPPPTAVLDVALLPPGGEVTIDPLANDTDPAGGVLVVQSIDVPEQSPLRVAVIDHRLLRISTTRTFDVPEVFTYTASNGVDSAVGQVVVQPVPATAGQQPPVVPDVRATVRAGAVVTIPVLEGAFDPDGDVLTLERALVEEPSAGLMFVSGDVLRFQAPGTPMEVRATFEVGDPMRNRTAATVTITVHASDPETKAPPRPVDLTARAYSGEEVVIDVPLVGIDDDGDGVTLLGVDQPPTKGVVRDVGSDSIVYEALPGEVGTDTFTYAVEDWTGQRAVAAVRVGIAPRPTGAVPVVTRDDAVTVRPGQTVEVRVLANDESSGGGDLTLDGSLVVQPEGATARVDGRRVVVDTPSTEGVLQILYTARNDRGGSDTGVLTVTVDEDAPILPPVAVDIVVPAADTINKTQVAVDVMETAQNPSGSLADLAVEVPASAAATAVAPGDGTVVVTLTDEPQTLPYLLVNTNPDAGRIASYAFITVPALGDFPPMQRPGIEQLSVIAGEPLTLDLAELVRVAPGRSPRIGDRSRVFATKSDGSALVVDDDTLRYVALADYAGPASVTVHVTDGPLSDPTVRDAMLTFEITVLARDENPPTFTPSVLEVPQADSVRVDLTAFTSAPASVDDDAASRYTYRVVGDPPPGFDVTLAGSVLTVGAQTTTSRGTVAAIPVEIGYGGAEPLAAQVDARVVASRQPLARVQDFTVPDGVEGGESVVRVLEGAFNPFAPSPLTVVSAKVETPGAGDAHVSGSSVVVNPARGYIGQLVVRYTVKDVLPDLERMVEGRITVVVRGKPGMPTAPRVVEARDRAVALAWEAPANNGEPIDSYRVTAVGTGVQQTCPSTACTITGLTNDVTYTFTVSAHNAVGWSEPSPASGEARPDTQPLAPAAPVVTRGDGILDVRWTPPDNPGSPILDYLVEITPTTPAGATAFTTTGTSYRITGLANGTVYSVRVRARNSAPQPGAWSAETTAKPAREPDAPTGLTASSGPNLSTIEVRWDAPVSDGGESVDGYEVTVNGEVVFTGDGSARRTTFQPSGFRRYVVAIRARNVVGWSPAVSTDGRVWTDPQPVTGLVAQDLGREGTPWRAGSARLTWQPPGDAGGEGVGISGYEVYVDGRLVGEAGGQATSVEIGSLLSGTYTFEVVVVNTEGLRSTPARAPAVAVTTVPAGVTLSETDVVPGAVGTDVVVRWDPLPPATPGITGWIFRSSKDDRWQTLTDPAATSIRVEDVPTGHRFWMEVAAVNARGAGVAGRAEVDVPEPGPQPPAPEP